MKRSTWNWLFALACVVFGAPGYFVSGTPWPLATRIVVAMLVSIPGAALFAWLSSRRPAL